MKKTKEEVMGIVNTFAHFKEVIEDIDGPRNIEDTITDYFDELTHYSKKIPQNTLNEAEELIRAEYC